MSYSKIKLNDNIRYYVLEKIKYGNALSNEIMKMDKIDFQDFFTYHMSNLKKSNLEFPKLGNPKVDFDLIINYYLNEIHSYLLEENSIVIFECSLVDRSCLSKLRHRSNILLKDNDLFFYISPEENNIKTISEIFGESSSSFQNLFFFSSLPSNVNIREYNEISNELLLTLAERTCKVFVDAYDLESFIECSIKK